MAQVSTPQLRASGNVPIVKSVMALLGPATAANMGAAAGVALSPSEGLVGDITFVVTVNGGETMAVSAKDWGGSTITAVEVINAATGNSTSATALASGTYSIPVDRGAGLYQALIFTKSAAVQQAAVAVCAAYDLNANL